MRLSMAKGLRSMKIKESDVRAGIKKYLALTGWLCYSNLQGLGCKVGLSDLTILKKGVVVWVELKRPGGKQSPAQLKFETEIRRAGGNYVCVHSVEELQNYIKGALPEVGEPHLF